MNNRKRAISARIIPTVDRVEYLKKFFDRKFGFGVSLVDSFMEKIASNYTSGTLNIYILSNGGFYLAPSNNEKLKCDCENGFSDELSCDAAGIIATLYALDTLASKTGADHFAEMYYLLQGYIGHHVEGRKIHSAID